MDSGFNIRGRFKMNRIYLIIALFIITIVEIGHAKPIAKADSSSSNKKERTCFWMNKV